ncbi:MAG: aminopeptidase N [Pseudomonadota bacterium]
MPQQNAIYRVDYTPPAYLIESVDLTVSIDAERTRVRTTLTLRRNGAGTTLELFGVDLETQGIWLNQRELPPSAYHIEGERLVLEQVPERCELITEVLIAPAANTALEGFYQSGEFLLTQCEAEGFRKITWFLDRPDVMARFRVRMEADAGRYPVLLSNGNLTAAGKLPDGRHFAVWDDPFPKPSYLFAMVAGDLACREASYQTASGRHVALKLYTEAPFLDQVDYALESLKRAMAWDEKRFGLEYDLDVYHVVATSDFNMGAMENKSLNIFNTKFVLAAPETATDHDFQDVESVIGHEYFHNWSGNRVTCRDWFQLSLKEGLTVFRDQEFSADLNSRALKRIEDVRLLRSMQFAEDAGPMSHPVRPDSYIEINNFYTMTVYQKGAEVVRMYHTLLGEEGFQRGMKTYFERHDGQAVTCDDFRSAMADANERSLAQFERWYSQAGTPIVTASGHFDGSHYTLTLAQHTPPTAGQPDKQPFHMPIRFGLLGRDGSELQPRLISGECTGAVLELREPQQTWVFGGLDQAPQPSLLRDFSAPVTLRWESGRPDPAFLMAHDSDPFNRWDASQTLASEVIFAAIEGDSGPLEGYLAAAGRLLADDTLDPALTAEALRLPDLSYLAESLKPLPVEALQQTWNSLKQTVGARYAQELRHRYDDEVPRLTYQPSAEMAARRALNGRCLDLMVASGDCELALAQYQAAGNMTDRLSALTPLVLQSTEQADALLEDFFARFSHHPLVMDKWLALQASVPDGATLERVKGLLSNPVFSLRNPNKVRALLGSFSRNLSAFNQAGGAGYEFVADQVLKLDRINPQVTARLVSAFNGWRRLDAERAAQAQAQLERIVGASELSPDVFEIVSKALAAPVEEAA